MNHLLVSVLPAFVLVMLPLAAEPEQTEPQPAKLPPAQLSPGPEQQPVQSASVTQEDATASTDARDRIYYAGETERVKPLARKLFSNIVLDQKEIWTSPFHIHSKDAKWWIGFGSITAALIATDHQTSTALENSKVQVAWGNRISKV